MQWIVTLILECLKIFTAATAEAEDVEDKWGYLYGVGA
jgi:hypothetical protein